MSEEIKNVSQMPRIFYAKHMRPGLAGYENETILVDFDGIKAMAPSMVGKPVYIHHQDVNVDSLKQDACGYVTDSFYNENDGWFWCKFLAIDDAAHEVVAKKWSVSNAYIPTDWSESGKHNNVDYDRKMLNGEFTHLALVPNPRYEEACIMSPEDFKLYQEIKKAQLAELKNSKPDEQIILTEQKPMLKFFKTSKQEITNADEITDDTFVEFQGRKISVKDLNEIMNAKKNDMRSEMRKNKDEDEDKAKEERENEVFDMDGEDVTMNELKDCYRASKKMKKNGKKAKENDYEDDEKETKAEERENDDSEEDDDEDDDGRDGGENRKKDEEGRKDNKKEKKNSKYFNEMRNAHLNQEVRRVVIETPMDKLARGRSIFGLSK